jgi:uncharacterized protein YciW
MPERRTALGPRAGEALLVAKKTTIRSQRAELQAWYLAGLAPKLAGAAATGTVSPAAAEALDRVLRDFLDLGVEERLEAAA